MEVDNATKYSGRVLPVLKLKGPNGAHKWLFLQTLNRLVYPGCTNETAGLRYVIGSMGFEGGTIQRHMKSDFLEWGKRPMCGLPQVRSRPAGPV